jgi:hypothetical protein
MMKVLHTHYVHSMTDKVHTRTHARTTYETDCYKEVLTSIGEKWGGAKQFYPFN